MHITLHTLCIVGGIVDHHKQKPFITNNKASGAGAKNYTRAQIVTVRIYKCENNIN